MKAEWSSKALFARTMGLLRNHPMLVFPVILADLLGLATGQDAVRAIRTPIFNWLFSLSAHDSVLSPSRGIFTMSLEHATSMAWMIGAMLEVSSRLIKVFFYSAALCITGEWLRGMDRGNGPSLHSMRGQWRKLARFSLIVWGGIMLTAVLAGVPFTLWLRTSAFARRLDLGLMGGLYALLLGVPLAYFIARPALMLIWKKRALPEPSTVRLARIVMMATIVAQFFIGLLINLVIDRAGNSTFSQMNGGELLVRDAIVSVAGAVPFIVSFIALSVLGSEDAQLTGAKDVETLAEF